MGEPSGRLGRWPARALESEGEEGGPAAAGADLSRETLARCKNQDPVAFRRFVHVHQRAVFALISRVTGRGGHVQDLAQEVFLRAYRAFPNFDLDGAARPSTWILTIAVRLALNAKKQQLRFEKSFSLADAAEVSDPATPETERARREIGRAIAGAAALLHDDQRAAFVLAEFHGMSIAEIARALDIPENTAKTRLFRAREQMRERLAVFATGENR